MSSVISWYFKLGILGKPFKFSNKKIVNAILFSTDVLRFIVFQLDKWPYIRFGWWIYRILIWVGEIIRSLISRNIWQWLPIQNNGLAKILSKDGSTVVWNSIVSWVFVQLVCIYAGLCQQVDCLTVWTKSFSKLPYGCWCGENWHFLILIRRKKSNHIRLELYFTQSFRCDVH